jgi:hypothetical protein
MGASFLSTVTPAQLPTFSLRPVRALYIVVLPELGLPAKAILIYDFLLFQWGDIWYNLVLLAAANTCAEDNQLTILLRCIKK